MEVDVVIPSLRPRALAVAVHSLSLGTRRPDLVTIVSNELDTDFAFCGLTVRLVRFRSSRYPIGSHDVALRRNIGIWNSPCSHVITFDDDQVAAADLVASSVALLQRLPFFWGHYRFIRLAGYPVEHLVTLRPDSGRAREHPPNSWHSWLSAYGGLSGARKDLLQEVGGYDLAFCGRHGGEDQDLGRRLALHVHGTDRIYVHEPPFAWHPEERLAWKEPRYSNLCRDGHELATAVFYGRTAQRCGKCPYFRFDDIVGDGDRVVVPFEPDSIELIVEELS